MSCPQDFEVFKAAAGVEAAIDAIRAGRHESVESVESNKCQRDAKERMDAESMQRQSNNKVCHDLRKHPSHARKHPLDFRWFLGRHKLLSCTQTPHAI